MNDQKNTIDKGKIWYFFLAQRNEQKKLLSKTSNNVFILPKKTEKVEQNKKHVNLKNDQKEKK